MKELIKHLEKRIKVSERTGYPLSITCAEAKMIIEALKVPRKKGKFYTDDHIRGIESDAYHRGLAAKGWDD